MHPDIQAIFPPRVPSLSWSTLWQIQNPEKWTAVQSSENANETKEIDEVDLNSENHFTQKPPVNHYLWLHPCHLAFGHHCNSNYSSMHVGPPHCACSNIIASCTWCTVRWNFKKTHTCVQFTVNHMCLWQDHMHVIYMIHVCSICETRAL
jgi:hypothetical protein